jgi:hypothetical protein
MHNEHALTLRQIDQARGDLYAIADELETVRLTLRRMPTPFNYPQVVVFG